MDGVTTVSRVAEVLDGEPVTLRLGQGVGPHERDYVRAAAQRSGAVVVDTAQVPAGRAAVHKHVAANVLIGDVRTSGPNEVVASLRLTGENELLLDHQTGLHVQGMVVVEAIRQMLLAGYETTHHHPNHYMVLNGIQLEFESFLFPLPARLSCELEPVAPNRRGTARIQIEQGGRQIASAQVRFTAFDAARIGLVEQRRAQAALQSAAGDLTMGVAA